jgi:hypothetical protein
MGDVTLAQAYYALAAFLLLAGWLIVTDAAVLRTFRRSKGATYLLGLAATAWFAWWLVSNMNEADFAGLPRIYVAAVFIGASLATFVYMPDFLSVRALGVLMLFLARATLDAGYRHLPYSLLDASVSYGVLVLFGFWWACSPPVFGRQFDWVLATSGRRNVVGGLSLLLGLACVAQSFNLP